MQVDGAQRFASNAPNHGHADRPCGIANTEPQVRVIGFLILPFLREMHNLGKQAKDVGFEFSRSE